MAPIDVRCRHGTPFKSSALFRNLWWWWLDFSSLQSLETFGNVNAVDDKRSRVLLCEIGSALIAQKKSVQK